MIPQRVKGWKVDANIGITVPTWLKEKVVEEANRRNITVNELVRRFICIGFCRSMESDFVVRVQELEKEIIVSSRGDTV